MSSAEIFVLFVIVIPLFLVSTNRMRLDIAGALTALTLAIGQFCGLGILDSSGNREAAARALSGFGEPVIITLFSLIIVTRCLDRTGVTRWIAHQILRYGNSNENRVIAIMAATSATLSLFMNNLAAGAFVLPSAMEVSRRSGIKASKLLIPVAFGSCLGGAATYFTTSNIIVSEMLRAANPPQAPLHILDFTPVGGLVALAGILYFRLFGSKVLPDREPSSEQQVARRTGSDLEQAYELNDRLWDARITAGSSLVGKQLREAAIGERLGITVLSVIRGKQSTFAPSPTLELAAGDHLLVVGREERVQKLTEKGIHINRTDGQRKLSASGALFIEMVLIPQSRVEGRTLKEIKFRSQYELTAVAIRRDGRSFRTDVAEMKLKHGDSILAVGSPARLRALQHSPDFLLIETDKSDKPVEWRPAGTAIALTAAAIIASIAGFPVYLGMFAAAMAIVLLGIISMEDVYRAMEWQAIILIAGMYPLSLAMVHTGLAATAGQYVVAILSPFGPLGVVGGAYILTALITQFIAGQVTMLIISPVLISAAITLHVNPQAVAVASAIACSASFLTPLSHPVNALMIGPGNYRFSDFFRAGWMLTILSFAMLLIGMKLFWTL